MTTRGVVGKTFLLLGILVLGVVVGRCFLPAAVEARSALPLTGIRPDRLTGYSSYSGAWSGTLAIVLGIIFMVASFIERAQTYLAPAFAFVQGLCMAAVVPAGGSFSGILAVACLLTCGILAALLLVYRFDCVPDLSNWQAAVGAFFISIPVIYGGVFLLRMFGKEMPFPHQTTVVWWSILSGLWFTFATNSQPAFDTSMMR